jgi:hypothetical protein
VGAGGCHGLDTTIVAFSEGPVPDVEGIGAWSFSAYGLHCGLSPGTAIWMMGWHDGRAVIVSPPTSPSPNGTWAVSWSEFAHRDQAIAWRAYSGGLPPEPSAVSGRP